MAIKKKSIGNGMIADAVAAIVLDTTNDVMTMAMMPVLVLMQLLY